MYQINRQEFGRFVAELRKEKGLTQRELAEQLYISDKAVSKWETGISVPDVALLIPLAELLEVSVTELLQCRRNPQDTPIPQPEVETLVKTAIAYSEGKTSGRRKPNRRNLVIYLLCLAVMVLELIGMYILGFTRFQLDEPIMVTAVLCTIFGLYFMIYMQETLPRYYDEYHISNFGDGPMRMNLPGVRISNRNWPYIVRVCRIWSCGMMIVHPALTILGKAFIPEYFPLCEKPVLMVLMLGGLMAPLIIVGRKYQ